MNNPKHTLQPTLLLLFFLISGFNLCAQSNTQTSTKVNGVNVTNTQQALISGGFSPGSITPLGGLGITPPKKDNTIKNGGGDYLSQDSTSSIAYCPMLYVDVDLTAVINCASSDAVISYCNQGSADAYNTYVDVELDADLTLDSASTSYTLVNVNTYRFQLGMIASSTCGSVALHVTSPCDSSLINQEHCIHAHIYPDTLCSSVWDHSLLTTKGTCDGTNIKFLITNSGNPVTPGQLIQFTIIEDHLLVQGNPNIIHQGILQVDKDSSVSFSILSSTSSLSDYKLEIREANNTLIASSSVHNCSLGYTPVITSYHLWEFWNGSILPFEDTDCAINSFVTNQSNSFIDPLNNPSNTGNSNNNQNSNNSSSFDQFNDDETKIAVFPNPFEQYTTIKIEGPISDEFTFKLYDVTGKAVDILFISKQRVFRVERNNLLDGMYFYHIESKGNLIGAGKIIVK
jgi:hypothetical protein